MGNELHFNEIIIDNYKNILTANNNYIYDYTKRLKKYVYGYYYKFIY